MLRKSLALGLAAFLSYAPISSAKKNKDNSCNCTNTNQSISALLSDLPITNINNLISQDSKTISATIPNNYSAQLLESQFLNGTQTWSYVTNASPVYSAIDTNSQNVSFTYSPTNEVLFYRIGADPIQIGESSPTNSICEGDRHSHTNGNGHHSHGNGNGYGHDCSHY